MSKKKVIIIGSAYPFRGGGISTFNERLAYAYQESGYEVTIYTFSLQYPSIFFPGTTQYSNEAPPEGLEIKIKINSINPFNWIKIGREIKTFKPDLVIVRFWIPFMAPCLGTICRIIKSGRIDVVAITDNIIPHERKPFDKLLAKYFVKSVNYFVTMSKSVLSDLESLDKKKPKKLTVHPLYDNFGKPVSKESAIKWLGLSPDFHYVLFFGFIREYKGLDLLLKAFSHPEIKKLPIRLLVVGEFYVDSSSYLKIIEDNQIKDIVILKNEFVPNTEVVYYFCASSLVVQPYKNATQSGITQVSFHFNKPIITTNVGGLSEIVTDDKMGYIVEPKSDEISIAILKYFNLNKESVFTENIKEAKIRFSWETMINTIDDLIKN
ncbi:MAG: glycosyltransferase [Bacteroidales bacterium]|nr:glycosyltransferase [Bacteroidales bacterium]